MDYSVCSQEVLITYIAASGRNRATNLKPKHHLSQSTGVAPAAACEGIRHEAVRWWYRRFQLVTYCPIFAPPKYTMLSTGIYPVTTSLCTVCIKERKFVKYAFVRTGSGYILRIWKTCTETWTRCRGYPDRQPSWMAKGGRVLLRMRCYRAIDNIVLMLWYA